MTQNGSIPAPAGLPGLRGTDHVGLTVPDMEQAHDFFVNVLGCVHVYSLGPFPANPELMEVRMGVHPETIMQQIRFYRCKTGANYEVFQYSAPDQSTVVPKNSDVGGHHFALYVDDMDEAVAYLRASGIEVMGEPTASSAASEGQRWVYFKSPWGLTFELVSFPNGKAYERDAETLLWDVRRPSE